MKIKMDGLHGSAVLWAKRTKGTIDELNRIQRKVCGLPDDFKISKRDSLKLLMETADRLDIPNVRIFHHIPGRFSLSPDITIDDLLFAYRDAIAETDVSSFQLPEQL